MYQIYDIVHLGSSFFQRLINIDLVKVYKPNKTYYIIIYVQECRFTKCNFCTLVKNELYRPKMRRIS